MNPVRFGSASDVVARMPSPKIWADCPVLQFQADPAKGFFLFDDFKNSTVSLVGDSDTALASGRVTIAGDINWYGYIESDVLVDVALQADDSGVLMLDCDGDDDDVRVITTGNNVAGVINMPTKGERKKFWFECRFKTSTITDTDMPIFVGLMAPGQAADGGPLGAAPTAPADVDYLGFFVAEADGDDLTIIYNRNTATAGTPQSDTGEITLAVDTWIRVGFRLDVSTDKIHVYVNGVDQGADAEIDISSANFPYDIDMDVVIALTEGAAGGNGDNLKIDWVRVAQEY